MPTNIALHSPGVAFQGTLPPAPELPALAGGIVGLAEDTPSDPITLQSPTVMVLLATTSVRVDVRKQADAASLDPAASAVVVPAGQRVPFYVKAGTWVVETTALT